MGPYYVFHKKSNNYIRRNSEKSIHLLAGFQLEGERTKVILTNAFLHPLLSKFLRIINILRRKNKTSAQVFRSIIYVRSKRCSLREEGIHFITITLHFMRRLCSSTVLIKNSWMIYTVQKKNFATQNLREINFGCFKLP